MGLIVMSSTGCGSSSGSDITYVAIGASDATGIGAEPPTKGYVYLLEDMLQDQCDTVELFNTGIPTAKIDEMNDFEIEVAEEVEPELITIWAGPNDLSGGTAVATFQAEVEELLTKAANTAPDVHIFIANLPDMTALPKYVEEPDSDVTTERINAFNQIIEEQAQAVGATVIDLSELTVDPTLVSEDGFHPSNAGHELIAQKFFEQVKPVICVPANDD